MRTKSSIRIMMTITMKLVPLMLSLRLSIRVSRYAAILPFFVQPKRLDLPDATAHSGKTPFSTAEARPA
jgi:hypothetical protein